MAMGLAMSFLLVLSLMTISIRTDDDDDDASRVNEQNNDKPYSLDDIFESGEDEDVEDLSNAVERLIQEKEEAASRQTRKYRPDIRSSKSNFEVYGENDKESRDNRFDDSESQRLQSNIIARKVEQIRSKSYNDFRSRESKLSDDEEQMERNNFNGFRIKRGDIDLRGSGQIKRNEDPPCDCKGVKGQLVEPKCCKGQKKRIIVEGIRIQRENPKCKGQKGVLSKKCPIQSERNHFDGFRIQRDTTNPKCKGEKDVLSKDCPPQTKRNHLDGFRIQREEVKPECEGEKGKIDEDNCKIQMEGNQFDGFRRSLSNLNTADISAVQIRKRKNFSKILQNRQNYGDLGTLQTEESQADRRLPPIQRGNFDDLEVEHDIQSRESGSNQAEFESNDYNSDEQLTNREDIHGQESRQIHDDPWQHLQPESDEGSPALPRRSNPLSDLDDDYGIDQEKRSEVQSIADDYKVSSTAEEASPDDLLALLVRLVRDKRQKEDHLIA